MTKLRAEEIESNCRILHPAFMLLGCDSGIAQRAQHFRQPCGSQLLVRQRRGAGTRAVHRSAPKRLVCKERHSRGGPARTQSRGGRPAPSMMHHGRDVLEQPVMRNVRGHYEHAVRRREAAESGPSGIDDGAYPCEGDSLEYSP